MSRVPSSASAPANGLSARRRRWFRLAAVLAPLVLVGLMEVGLRLAGRHRPTDFWLPSSVSGELIPNPEFASRFVGSSMARMPRSIRLSERARENTLRIVVFGESAAMGDPEPAFGVPRCLQALLEARLPGRRIEVVNTAITALNSHALREAARDSQRLKADFWVIYAGNNEVIGPFGPASVTGGQPPGLGSIRLVLSAGRSALGQWLTGRRALTADGLSLTQRWAGLEMFLDRPVPADDPRLLTVREYFGKNLQAAVKYGLNSGTKVLLSTMAVNLTDCAPFGSVRPQSTNDSTYLKWAAAVDAGRLADQQGDVGAALAAWTNAAALRTDHAETRYRLGLARLNAGEGPAARQDLERARNLDTLRFRADSGLNDVIRDVGRRLGTDRLLWVDAARDLTGPDTNQPPGVDLFLEHVHLRPEGNYRLARLFAEQIVSHLGSPATSGPWLNLNECLERLGWNPFAEARLWNQTRALTQRPPFTRQSNAELRERFLDDRVAEANSAARQMGLTLAVQRVQSVVHQNPDDWPVREQLARLLQTGRQWSNAAVQWRQILDAAPAHVVGWYQLGESLVQAGERPAAIQAYEKALSIRPDFVDARLGLGLVLGESGQRDAALRSIDTALSYSPEHLQARVNRGLLLIGSGKFEEGAADLRRAATDNPTSILPLVRLAEALSTRKEYYRAANVYAEATRREPANAALHHRYAVELSRTGRLLEAETAFGQALKADPNFVAARVDLGVALAQRGRFGEAIPEFEAALRIQPTNTLAQTYLDRARQQMATPKP